MNDEIEIDIKIQDAYRDMYEEFEDTISYRDLESFPWQIDVDWWDIKKNTFELMLAANMLQEYKMSLRETSRETCIPKSTLHEFIHESLIHYSYECYRLCVIQLNWNKKNIKHFVDKNKWRKRK